MTKGKAPLAGIRTGFIETEDGRWWIVTPRAGWVPVRSAGLHDLKEQLDRGVMLIEDAKELSPRESYRATPATPECTCYRDCRADSRSGQWHQHEEEPCTVHPDAPVVG